MSYIKRYNYEGLISEAVLRRIELEELRAEGMDKNVGIIVAVENRLKVLQGTRAYWEYFDRAYKYHKSVIVDKE